jgi:hypothetical protein
MLIAGLILFAAFAAGVAVGRRGTPAALPQAWARMLPAPTKKRSASIDSPLYELAGLLTVREKDVRGRGSVTFVVRKGREYEVGGGMYLSPELIGTVLVEHLGLIKDCTYCCVSDTVQIDIVDKVSVPDGVTDFGYVRRWVIGVYCGACGLKQSVTPHPRNFAVFYKAAIEPFASTPNLLEALKILAETNGKLTKEIRYRLLLDESARVRALAASLADGVSCLLEELRAPERPELPSAKAAPAPSTEIPPPGTMTF